MARPHEELLVPVRGGELAVTRWPVGRPDVPVVVAVHGITANSLSWARVAQALDGVEVIAPDLRGRAHSRSLPGPYGIATHATDVLAVLDQLGHTGQVALAGHSMGGFVACVTAARAAELLRGVVLVDGGLGFGLPEDVDVDAQLETTLGPAIQRLYREFASADEYHEFWRTHPAFDGIWDESAIAYIDRDLVGEPPHLRSSCVAEGVRTDGADVLRDERTLAAIGRLTTPTTLLWAPRGLLNEPTGLYNEQSLAATLPSAITAEQVPDTNHYSILLAAPAAATVAGAIRAALSAG